MDWLAIIVTIGVFIGVGVVMFFYERHVVQKGHCGLPWQSFDMDSQGGIGLCCQKCKARTWVSWYRKGFVGGPL